MSKRFQKGYVYAVGKQWYGRYRRDIPDQEERAYPSVVLGPRKEMSKLEARQKLMEIIAREGLNETTYLETLAMTAETFNDVADAWELKRLPQLRISTQKSAPGQIAKHLRPFFGHLVLDSIKTGTVNEWIGTLDLAPKTVHNLWKQFTIIMNWHSQQLDQPKRAWYPTLPTIPYLEQRWFTQNEMRQIIDVAHGQYKVFFHLAAATGLRFGELAGLHVEDVVAGVVYARRSIYRGMEVEVKTVKGYRGVCIDSGTQVMLKTFLGDRTTGRIFRGERGAPLDNHAVVGEVLKPICKRLGIEPGGCHAFRHGRNSHMDMNHVPEKFKTNQMGHSSLRVNNIYTHFSDEFVRDTVESLALSCTQVHTN